jgi:transcription antitermination protein NusB
MRWLSYEPTMLRLETKSRARALQILYAWELRGSPPIPSVASGLARLTGPEPRVLDRAEALAAGVVAEVADLDAEAASASENWRMSRIAVVERNILRLGIHELRRGEVPPKVAIDEAVHLAHWFGDVRAPGFVNGILDGIARSLGRL